MSKEFPMVSAIVPCLNEERFISACLDSIVANDYPKDKLEILIIDGASSDKTRDIVRKYIIDHKTSVIRLFENPRKIIPVAMNIGIENSKGAIIIRIDAHSFYEKDYISKCVGHLLESGAGNVGGVLRTVPFKKDFLSDAIAICLSTPFGAGYSGFRVGSIEPREADAVAFGCYKKKTLMEIGLFNEKFERTEDLELNSRIRKKGGKIMLFPDIKADYYSTSDNLGKFFRHNFIDGVWLTYPIKFGFYALSPKRLAPAVLVLLLFIFLLLSPFHFFARLLFDIIAISYLSLNFIFSGKIALKKGVKYFFIMPVVFACRHFGYGLGSLWGLLKALR